MKSPERGGGYSCAMRAEPVITVDEPGWGARRAPLPADRELRADRRPEDGRAGRHGRIDRLVLPPALRRAQPLRGDPRRRHRRLLPRRALDPVLQQAALPAGHRRPCHALLQRQRRRRGHRLHAHGARALRAGSPRRRGARRGRPPHVVPAGLRLRPPGPPPRAAPPRLRALHGLGRLGHRAALEPAHGRRRRRRRGALHPGGRRGGLVRPAAGRLRGALVGRRRRALPGADPRPLAPLGEPHAVRRALARDGPALGHHAQALHLLADRGHGRRAHHEPAGDDRRRAQLGLPLRLAARLGLHRLRLPAPGLLRRGRRLQRLARAALPRDRSLRPAAPDRLRPRRRQRPHRARAGPPLRLPRLAPGAHRQRSPHPAPARRLRRAHGRGLPLEQDRAHQLGALEQPAPAPRLAGRQLAPARRGHLGGARRAARLRLLAADVLGGLRARDAHAVPARAARRHAQVAPAPRRDLRGDHGQAAGAARARPSSSTTAATSSTRATC